MSTVWEIWAEVFEKTPDGMVSRGHQWCRAGTRKEGEFWRIYTEDPPDGQSYIRQVAV